MPLPSATGCYAEPASSRILNGRCLDWGIGAESVRLLFSATGVIAANGLFGKVRNACPTKFGSAMS